MKKLIRGILVYVLVLGLMCQGVYLKASAEDQGTDTGSVQSSAVEQGAEETSPQEVPSEEQTEQENAADEAAAEQEEQTETNQDALDAEVPEQQNENADPAAGIEYIYLDKPYIEAGEEQNIAVSFKESAVENMQLVYSDSNGMESTWNSNYNADGIYLFSQSFTNVDKYKLERLVYTEGGVEQQIVLADQDLAVQFGVGVICEEDPESQYIEMESLSDAGQVSSATAIVDTSSMSEENTAEEVAGALSEAGAATEAVGYALEPRAEKNIVVVLDPGHDAGHAGASANGVKEEVATLKIAQYCKAELEKYAGVTVYMTREDAACPYPETVGVSSGNILDIKKRVQWAASVGADAFVSFHLDSAGSSAHGAHVYFPGEDFADKEVAETGKGLAQKIQQELVAVGLYNRGTESADYAVNTEAAKYGFPGLIIEHAFLTNVSDANTYLKSEAELKQLGVADAQGIIKYFGLSEGYWKTENGKTYYYENNQRVYGEKFIAGKWYYFSETTGAMQTGLVKVGNRTLGYDSTGAMVFGEAYISGKWRYFSTQNGNMVKNSFQYISEGNKTVYYGEDGGMLFGKQTIQGKEYYFELNSGAMRTGFSKTESGKTCYYNTDGSLAKGEIFIDGSWYCFHETTGAMITGFKDLSGKRVYYDQDGKMLFGEHNIGGKWYYFSESDGGMARSSFVQFAEEGKTVYYDKNGAMLFGAQTIQGKEYYFALNNGAMQTGFVTLADGTTEYYFAEGGKAKGEVYLDGYWYYFDAKKGMATGILKLETKTVCYDENGRMLFGEQTVNGREYCFSLRDGSMVTGIRETSDGRTVYYTEEGTYSGEIYLDGYWYCFDETTKNMVKGLKEFPEKTVYYNDEGKMQFGEQNVDGHWFFFSYRDGGKAEGFQSLDTRTVYYDKDRGMLFGKQTIDGNTYFFEYSNGNMVRSAIRDNIYYGSDGIATELAPILGNSECSTAQMERYFLAKGGKYPEAYADSDAPTITDFCNIYYEEAGKQGVRAEVAFAQAMKETGWLRFGNDVKPEQFNFAGLGAIGGGAQGASFATVREGVRAQIQHLYAYASETGRAGLVEPCADPRFDLVSPKGTAPLVQWLGQQENPQGYGWATSKDYGVSIVKIMQDLKKY